jgi:hypothetical protein
MVARMRNHPRRSGTKVCDGRVRHKNNWGRSPTVFNTTADLRIYREKPGKGYRHLLHQEDLRRFVGLLPDWEELSRGLRAVVLAAGCGCCYGTYYDVGVVRLRAWRRDLWESTSAGWYWQYHDLFERLGVPYEQAPSGRILQFTEATARAYQLLHVFLHELGHHHDRMTTRGRAHSARGEGYADDYAMRYMERIWERYQDIFGLL